VEQTMFGINLPDLADAYSSCEDHDSVAEVVSRTRDALGRLWYPVPDASPGDIVILNIGGRPWHCGVVTAGDWMLHMQKGVNVGLERFTREPWRNRVEGIYHYAG
jgi:cell wall-associated NlpC family hydrolase